MKNILASRLTFPGPFGGVHWKNTLISPTVSLMSGSLQLDGFSDVS